MTWHLLSTTATLAYLLWTFFLLNRYSLRNPYPLYHPTPPSRRVGQLWIFNSSRLEFAQEWEWTFCMWKAKNAYHRVKLARTKAYGVREGSPFFIIHVAENSIEQLWGQAVQLYQQVGFGIYFVTCDKRKDRLSSAWILEL